ncbi:exo-beta-N-acetylmuramidase NamZ family protein [Spirosoma horti]
MTFLTKLFFIGFSMLAMACQAQTSKQKTTPAVQTGADQMNLYLPTLQGKRVGLVVNHTSRVGAAHLVDSLLSRGVSIKTIFAPEHGFRGQATDGEEISSGRDPKTGIMITSLYGKNRKPTPQQMDSLDVVVFDIQDVGARFYTYTSTMHYVMEACAEANKPMILLDRPNPNGHYVDGPVLEAKFKSFVGLNPIPVVYGLTMGELARMINGQGWLAGAKTCPLTVIPLKNYTHQTPYTLSVPPSPNLPNQQAILLYPSLCFFEGTVVSVGRGTDKQFQVIGSPYTKYGPYTFTPVDKPGAINPPLEGQLCYGLDLSAVMVSKQGLMLDYFFDFFNRASDKSKFFLANNGIDRLAGTDQLRLQLLAGVPVAKIRKSWEPGINAYKLIRKKYLLYP